MEKRPGKRTSRRRGQTFYRKKKKTPKRLPSISLSTRFLAVSAPRLKNVRDTNNNILSNDSSCVIDPGRSFIQLYSRRLTQYARRRRRNAHACKFDSLRYIFIMKCVYTAGVVDQSIYNNNNV